LVCHVFVVLAFLPSSVDVAGLLLLTVEFIYRSHTAPTQCPSTTEFRNIEKVWGARYLYIIRDAEKFVVRVIH
jgi:hypothetical protein